VERLVLKENIFSKKILLNYFSAGFFCLNKEVCSTLIFLLNKINKYRKVIAVTTRISIHKTPERIAFILSARSGQIVFIENSRFVKTIA